MNKKTLAAIYVFCFILSTMFFWQKISAGALPDIEMDGTRLGKLCVSQVYPAISRGVERTPAKNAEQATEKNAPETNKPSEKKQEVNKKNSGADNSKPLVIIYHTHTTESYQPYDESNFHRVKETGTVRDVGNVMVEELNSLGIGAVHDKTLHDRPSYNESYDRSLETVTALQKKYPTAKYIIDLHRDAAAYSGNVGKTTKINGETVAKFSLVVGQNNANFSKLMAYAKKVNDKAETMYKGFGGRVIEKTYRYNEYISDKCLLLEIGNNQNNIKEVKATGKYFAHVLAAVIDDER